MERTKRISGQTLALAIISVLLMASLAMTFTGAWFSDMETDTSNGHTFGTIELTDIGAGSVFTFATQDEVSADVIMPGDELNADFTIDNNGTADAWVRFQINVTGAADAVNIFTSAATSTVITGFTFDNGWYYGDTALIGDVDGIANETENVSFTFSIPTNINVSGDYDAHEGLTVNFELKVEAVQVANNGASAVLANWTSDSELVA